MANNCPCCGAERAERFLPARVGYGKDLGGWFRYAVVEYPQHTKNAELHFATHDGCWIVATEGEEIPEAARLRTKQAWESATYALQRRLWA